MLDKKSLNWSIHFVIGFSKTCYRSLVDIEVGDVLLISNNLAYAVIYNTKICDLIYPEELKMADHFEYEEDFETDDFDKTSISRCAGIRSDNSVERFSLGTHSL